MMIRNNEGAQGGLYNILEGSLFRSPGQAPLQKKRGGSSHAGPDPWIQGLETSGDEGKRRTKKKKKEKKKKKRKKYRK